MKSQSILVVGASYGSLVLGYVAGTSGDNTPLAEESATHSNSKAQTSSSSLNIF